MRIDLRTAYEAATVDQTSKTSARTADQSRQAAKSADVSSDVQLSGLEAKAVSVPDIRQDRVNQLRRAISSGTYSVSNRQLAQAMMSDVLNR